MAAALIENQNQLAPIRIADDGGAKFKSPLIEGLPDDLARRCLARASRQDHASMQSVCHSWASFMASAEVSKLRQEAGISEELLYVLAVADVGSTYRWGVFTPSTGLWRKLGPVPFLRSDSMLRHFEATPAGYGLLLVLGGSIWEPGYPGLSWSSRHWKEKLAASREVWIYRAATDTWCKGPPMLTARKGRFACALIDSKVVVAGGSDIAGDPLPHAEALDLNQPGDISNFHWEALPAFSPRRDCPGISLGGCLWVMPGRWGVRRDFGNLCESAAVLNVKEGTWHTVLGFWRSSEPAQIAIEFDGRIIASDGFSSNQGLTAYDTNSGKWKNTEPRFLTSGKIAGLARVDADLYSASCKKMHEEYDPNLDEFEMLLKAKSTHRFWIGRCTKEGFARALEAGGGPLTCDWIFSHQEELNRELKNPSRGPWEEVAGFTFTGFPSDKLDLTIFAAIAL